MGTSHQWRVDGSGGHVTGSTFQPVDRLSESIHALSLADYQAGIDHQ
jgi:hypothetical protein